MITFAGSAADPHPELITFAGSAADLHTELITFAGSAADPHTPSTDIWLETGDSLPLGN
jgi:hypothetical protein